MGRLGPNAPNNWAVWVKSPIAMADTMLSYGQRLFGAIWVQITLPMGDSAIWGESALYG